MRNAFARSWDRTASAIVAVLRLAPITVVLGGCGSTSVSPPATQLIQPGGEVFTTLGLSRACQPWFGQDVVAAFCPTEKARPGLQIKFGGPAVVTQASEPFVAQAAGPPLGQQSQLTLMASSDVRGELAVRGLGPKGGTLLGRFPNVQLHAHRRYPITLEWISRRPAFVLRNDDDALVARRQVSMPAMYPPQRNLLVPIGPKDCPAAPGQNVADAPGDAFYLGAEDRSPPNGSADLRRAELRVTRRGVCAGFAFAGPPGEGATIVMMLRAGPGDAAEDAVRIVFGILAGVARVHVLRGFDTTGTSPARAAGYERRGNEVRLFVPNALLPRRFRHGRPVVEWQAQSINTEGAWQSYDCSPRYGGSSNSDDVAKRLGVCNLLRR